MKRAIKYLLAVLLTAWTGALTLAVGVGAFVWLMELLDRAAESGAFLVVVMFAALIALTVTVSEMVKSLMRKWDNKKD